MRAVLFHNPDAGMKEYDKENVLAALKLAGIKAHYVSTKGDGVKKALKKHADLFIVAGGDGTIGKILTQMPDRTIPVAILPLGTANNIARSLGIAGTPHELAESWHLEHARKLDVGTANGAWGNPRFIEAFGLGLVPRMIDAGDGGKEAMGANNLRNGRRALRKVVKHAKPFDADIRIDGKPLKLKLLGLEVLNIAYTGPGLPLAGAADAGDGLLDVVCFEAGQRDKLMDWIDAPHRSPPPVTCVQGCKIDIEWRDAPARVDDEFLDATKKAQQAEIVCSAHAARILMPVVHPAAHAGKARPVS